MNRTTQLFAVLVALATVVGTGVVATTVLGGETAQQEASVSIEDQPTDGETVVVDSVTVPDGGFVVIHDDSLEDGEVVDSVVGVSRYLEAGTHEDVPVTVGQEFDTTDDIEVTAMAHQDTNGNEVFDFVTADGDVDGAYTTGGAADGDTETPGEDNATETPDDGVETETPEEDGMTETPEENETETPEEDGVTETPDEAPEDGIAETPDEAPDEDEGEPVTDTATIDALSDETPDTNLAFENQTSNGSTVTVDRVTLYQGGYVVIHDESLQDDGDDVESIVGHSAYLEPGTYEDIEITLAEPLDADEEENLTAMPHHDTNENLVFDFGLTTGDVDEPYTNTTDEDDPVTVTAMVTVENETDTETPVDDEAETPAEDESPVDEETETPDETETPEEDEMTETPEETESPTDDGAASPAGTETPTETGIGA